MNFQNLHELLRLELLRRIEQGDLTGTRLAQQTGFQQAHISNFLNRKRALSLEGLDRVLAAQSLTIDQVLPLHLSASADRSERELVKNPAPDLAQTSGDLLEIPLVPPSAAADQPQIHPQSTIDSIRISASLLSESRTRQGRRTRGWQRFVAIRPDAEQASAMQPWLRSGCIAVIDRHYNSLAPPQPYQPALLAVRFASGLLIRHVEFADGRLLLRPSSIKHSIQLIEVAADQTPSDYIVGRICLLIDEL